MAIDLQRANAFATALSASSSGTERDACEVIRDLISQVEALTTAVANTSHRNAQLSLQLATTQQSADWATRESSRLSSEVVSSLVATRDELLAKCKTMQSASDRLATVQTLMTLGRVELMKTDTEEYAIMFTRRGTVFPQIWHGSDPTQAFQKVVDSASSTCEALPL